MLKPVARLYIALLFPSVVLKLSYLYDFMYFTLTFDVLIVSLLSFVLVLLHA